MKPFTVASFLLIASVGFAKSGGQSIRIFILPNQSAEANEKLRLPYGKLISSTKDKAEVELQKALGKLEGDTYKTGFRKIELPKCTLYLHKDTRNMEELGKMLNVLKSASTPNGSAVPQLEFKNLPKDVRNSMASILEASPDSIKGSANCVIEPAANFSYEYKGENHPISFPWAFFDKKLKLNMQNLPEAAFVKPELAQKVVAAPRTTSWINQSGFEVLVEPGVGGQAESEAIEKSVKYVNEKYASIETEYNSTESRLLDQMAETTFGRGLNSDNFRLKNLENLSKHERNRGQNIDNLFHDPYMSAAESEAMRSAQFGGISLCFSLYAMRSEHNGSNVNVQLNNPFRRP